MEMLPAQLFFLLYGILTDPNFLPMISATPTESEIDRESLENSAKWHGKSVEEIFHRGLPSPPHIIASEITPIGESRQKTRTQITSMRT